MQQRLLTAPRRVRLRGDPWVAGPAERPHIGQWWRHERGETFEVRATFRDREGRPCVVLEQTVSGGQLRCIRWTALWEHYQRIRA